MFAGVGEGLNLLVSLNFVPPPRRDHSSQGFTAKQCLHIAHTHEGPLQQGTALDSLQQQLRNTPEGPGLWTASPPKLYTKNVGHFSSKKILAAPHNMWDFSPLTQGSNPGPCLGRQS